MAKRRRNLLERLALGVMAGAVLWVVVHGVAGQLHKTATDELVTPGELTLELAAGDERVVYLEPGARDAMGFAVGPAEVDCTVAAASTEPPPGDPGSSAPVTSVPGGAPAAADLLDVQTTRGGDARLLDGWQEHPAAVTFTAFEGGTYLLVCRDRAVVDLGLGRETEAAGATLHVAEPLTAPVAWADPQQALILAFLVIAFAGIVFVVAAAFGRSG